MLYAGRDYDLSAVSSRGVRSFKPNRRRRLHFFLDWHWRWRRWRRRRRPQSHVVGGVAFLCLRLRLRRSRPSRLQLWPRAEGAVLYMSLMKKIPFGDHDGRCCRFCCCRCCCCCCFGANCLLGLASAEILACKLACLVACLASHTHTHTHTHT